MKILLLAGLFTAAAAPMAFADEGAPCQVDTTRRAIERVIPDTESGSAPVAPGEVRVARPPAQREAAVTTSARVPAQTTQQQQRRRNGKRIPDAELIGPRGAL